MSNNWEMVIGLEVHAQLNTSSKLFSSSPNQFGSEPNENVNFIDSGMPGMLPVMNFACIEMAIKTGFALNFNINKYSVFERKNYFYPDLPQGYQISQFEFPILTEGFINIDNEGCLDFISVTDAGWENSNQETSNYLFTVVNIDCSF